MRHLKAILLDVDGTLLDSNDAHARSWVEALRHHGHDVPLARVRELIGKGGDKLLAESVGIDDDSDEGERIGDARKRVFAEEWLPRLKPTRGARALLERFRDDGLALVVATSAGGDELEGLLRQAGVDDLIEDASSSQDAGRSKPDPDIVHAALAKAGVDPRRAWMLGDTPYDIEAARAAGVETIALRCGGWWPDAALAGAIAIHDDPAALLAAWSTLVRERETGRKG